MQKVKNKKFTKNFKSIEFDEIKGDGTGLLMDIDFIKQLQSARNMSNLISANLGYDREIIYKINSGYRRPGKLKSKSSSHQKGLACDISVINSRQRFFILYGLICAHFTRIGIYDKHIHVDNDTNKHQHVIWWGVSK